jgi:hypothetical protein
MEPPPGSRAKWCVHLQLFILQRIFPFLDSDVRYVGGVIVRSEATRSTFMFAKQARTSTALPAHFCAIECSEASVSRLQNCKYTPKTCYLLTTCNKTTTLTRHRRVGSQQQTRPQPPEYQQVMVSI